ncbi:hypothetical protein ANRL1_02814 [Anaerolineae bacterium]|nr:hypothetical protein ANRL1_02814 [Anaerolineae bacterium]
MSICDELEELIPAYVLDAVDESTRALVEKHLPHCPICTELVAAYRPVADLLPYAAPIAEPSADLKYRVLAATMPKSQPKRAPMPSFVNQLSVSFSALFHSPAFAMVAVILVIALGVWNVSLQNQLTQQSAAQAALNKQFLSEITRQRDVMSVMAYGAGQPRQINGTEVAARSTGRLYGKSDQTTLLFVVHGLPKSQAGKVYQIWLIDASGDRTSGGTFIVEDDGYGWALIKSPKPINEYQGIGVTEEPAGGSPKPTGPRMMGTSL